MDIMKTEELIIKIIFGNEAFDTEEKRFRELARIFTELADDFENHLTPVSERDINGNRVMDLIYIGGDV
jgi:hypothetical protein